MTIERSTSAASDSNHAITDAAVHLGHGLVDHAARHLETSEEKIRRGAAAAQDKVKTSMQAARTHGLRAGTGVGALVARHPWTALGIAAGIGAAVALWRHSGRADVSRDIAAKQ